MPKKHNDYRNFIDIHQVRPDALREILDHSKKIKAMDYEEQKALLKDHHVALVFEKPSTRTRVSFEVGVKQLGGSTVVLESGSSQLGRGEPISDMARVLTRYVDLVMIRTFKHETLKELVEFTDIPVINGLTDYSHPCQVMADILTIEEKFGSIEGKQVTWLGDFNNMATSWIHAAEAFNFTLHMACPKEMAPQIADTENVVIINEPIAAVKNSDVVMTDTWVSMGDMDGEYKKLLLKPYQVNSELMRYAKDEAIFLHCLPAHRDEEVTGDVIDGAQSAVFDQAENRLHVQKSIMLWCLRQI